MAGQRTRSERLETAGQGDAALLLWPLLLPGFQQLDHFGYALNAFLWVSFCGVDPAKVGASVELGQGVEECRRLRMRSECGGDIFGEVVPLWTFGFDVDRDGVADGEAAAAQPSRAEGEPESPSAGSTTPRTPMWLTVPAIWWRRLVPQTVSGLNGTGMRTPPRAAAATVAVNC